MRRFVWSSLAFVLSTLALSGCLWEEGCPDYGDPPPVASGRYRGIVLGNPSPTLVAPSSIPSEGAPVSATVDRNAGTVQMRWTASDGRVVVETWRLQRLNP